MDDHPDLFGDTSSHRRTLAAILACCLLAVALSAGAYSALAAGKGPAPKAGSYSGLAGVDKVSFKVGPSGTTITNFASTFNLAVICGVPANTAHETFPTLAITNGRFSGSVAIGQGPSIEHLAVQGKFVSPTKVTGKFSGHFTIKSLPPCHGSSTFSAQRKGK